MEEIDIKNINGDNGDYKNNYIEENKNTAWCRRAFSDADQLDLQKVVGAAKEQMILRFNKNILPDVIISDRGSDDFYNLPADQSEQYDNNKNLQIVLPKCNEDMSSCISLKTFSKPNDLASCQSILNPSKIIKNYNSEQDLLEFSDNITSIKNIDIKQTLKKGQKILDKNEFFYDLDKIMTDKKFKNFYEKYFKDIVDIKVILLYMKLYETIQKEYFVLYNTEIDNKLLAYMIKELMNNDMSRSKIMKSFHNFLESENNPKNRNNYKKFLLDFFDKKNK